MKEMIVKVVKPFADMCFEMANSISPDTAIIFYILVLAVICLWVITLRQEKPQKAAGSSKLIFLTDLRLWAVLILVIQAAIYLIFR